MEWYLKAMRQYFDFRGRARRKEYWMFILFYVLGAVALSILDSILGTVSAQGQTGLLASLFMFAHLIPGIAVGIRRLHDRGMTGWWILLGLVPLVNLVLLVIYALDGERGTNRFGPDPKARGGDAPESGRARWDKDIYVSDGDYGRSDMPVVRRSASSDDPPEDAWPDAETTLDRLDRLSRLRDEGALSDEEFESEKKKILRDR